jgi:hypothetical protein
MINKENKSSLLFCTVNFSFNTSTLSLPESRAINHNSVHERKKIRKGVRNGWSCPSSPRIHPTSSSLRHGQRPPIGQGIPTPLPPSQPPSSESSKGGDSVTWDTGSSTGTTTDNRTIVQTDGTFASTPCTLHTDGKIQWSQSVLRLNRRGYPLVGDRWRGHEPCDGLCTTQRRCHHRSQHLSNHPSITNSGHHRPEP